MNASRTANLDQMHATLRDRRPALGHTCDAFDRCDDCKTLGAEYVAARLAARVEAETTAIPAPRRSALAERLNRG